MTVTIDLTAEQYARIQEAARHSGRNPSEVASDIVTKHLPDIEAPMAKDPMLALFEQWDEEDADMTPDEIEAENKNWETFKANINAERARAGSRLVY